MICVICEAPLKQSDREGIVVDECPAGHGTWLDSGELRTVVETEQVPRSAQEREAALDAGVPASDPDIDVNAPRECPVCQNTLEKVNYDETSGIMIDTCGEHGVWLDAGEIERIEAWIEANREELAPVRARLEAELARNQGEVDAAYAAGRGKGPLGLLWSMVHYARHGGRS